MKLKTLPPTLRDRKRYILFKIISEEKIDFLQFKEAFFNTVLNFFGEIGFSKISPKFLENLFNEQEYKGVLRVYYKHLSEAILCLGLISRIGESRVNVKIYKVSGTIKSLMESNLKIKKN
ncbi:MAG: Rpp14/Pop5 family protein [Candidatus Aenigmarchaeota archaeon]|nr:ribonuclease P protein component 2 [Candidatus Aenigmarchaeota archaeon]MDW8159975.1 Rpp14/Pop5 family protein [Candidatus Aenigmarchaeota archaeon]